MKKINSILHDGCEVEAKKSQIFFASTSQPSCKIEFIFDPAHEESGMLISLWQSASYQQAKRGKFDLQPGAFSLYNCSLDGGNIFCTHLVFFC
jgi:hypothetical protein